MAFSVTSTSTSTGGVRHVRCPKCHSVLQEPTGVPVYQCGGCGASLKAKIRSGDAQAASVGAAPSPESVSRSPRLTSPRPSQSARLGSGDVASTSAPASTTDAPATARHQGAGTTVRPVTGALTPERMRQTSAQAAPIVEKEGSDHRSAAYRGEADGSSGRPRIRGAVSAPSSSANFSRDAAAELQDSERRPEAESEKVNATTKRGSDEASAGEAAAISARAADSRSAPAAVIWERRDDVTVAASAAAEEKAPSPPPRSADRGEAGGSSGRHRGRGAVSAPGATANFSRRSRDAAAELQYSERIREGQSEPVDATTKRRSDEAARPRSRDLGEAAPLSARAADSRSAPAAVSWERQDDITAAAPMSAEEKAPSPPPRHGLSPQKMSPLHEKILKTVDELKDDLSELFRKSPELKPSTPPRTPRHPAQEGHASRPAIPTSRPPRHAAAAAALHRRGNAGYTAEKHGQAAHRGLPSRKYRRCRADPCGGHDARPAGPCRRHSCCDHGKPECGSCRGHCCGSSRAREPARPHAAVAEDKRRAPPPKQHCRPVLKGAPFIVCSSCFTLVQVPAGFAVASARVRDLRCGACSAVLSYSYRDPDRKKAVDLHGASPAPGHIGGCARPDLFSFIEDFAGGVSSYSTTEDERPLHVSRNSSFDTVVDAAEEETGALPQRQSNSLHRLMGYGSARELLHRRSPSLYEYGSFDDKRSSTPPSRRHVDRKGKAVCLDSDAGDDDSDDSGVLRRSNVRRGAGWGIPTPGAIKIRS